MMNTAERLKKFPADSSFMVTLLYTMKPGHAIFCKGYVVPKKEAAV